MMKCYFTHYLFSISIYSRNSTSSLLTFKCLYYWIWALLLLNQNTIIDKLFLYYKKPFHNDNCVFCYIFFSKLYFYSSFNFLSTSIFYSIIFVFCLHANRQTKEFCLANFFRNKIKPITTTCNQFVRELNNDRFVSINGIRMYIL